MLRVENTLTMGALRVIIRDRDWIAETRTSLVFYGKRDVSISIGSPVEVAD